MPPSPPGTDWLADSALVPGGVVEGRYEVAAELSGAGLSRVWRGYDRAGGGDVCLKLIAPDPGGGVSRRFVIEQQALRRIEHPSIVRLKEVVERADGFGLLVLEWIDAPTLRSQLVKHAPMETRRACAIAIRIVEALDAVHAAGLVHGDVKPENVLVDRTNDATWLVDFGLAQEIGEAPGALVIAQVAAGTPQYMSPEQIRGQPLAARSDLYSCGIVIYELVAGEAPFVGTANEVRQKHLGSRPVPPGVVALGDVPEEIGELVLAMLAKDVAARPGSADVLGVLRRFAVA